MFKIIRKTYPESRAQYESLIEDCKKILDPTKEIDPSEQTDTITPEAPTEDSYWDEWGVDGSTSSYLLKKYFNKNNPNAYIALSIKLTMSGSYPTISVVIKREKDSYPLQASADLQYGTSYNFIETDKGFLIQYSSRGIPAAYSGSGLNCGMIGFYKSTDLISKEEKISCFQIAGSRSSGGIKRMMVLGEGFSENLDVGWATITERGGQNGLGLLSAVPVWYKYNTEIIDDLLLIDSKPDNYETYLGDIEFEKKKYLRVGYVLIPYET